MKELTGFFEFLIFFAAIMAAIYIPMFIGIERENKDMRARGIRKPPYDYGGDW